MMHTHTIHTYIHGHSSGEEDGQRCGGKEGGGKERGQPTDCSSRKEGKLNRVPSNKDSNLAVCCGRESHSFCCSQTQILPPGSQQAGRRSRSCSLPFPHHPQRRLEVGKERNQSTINICRFSVGLIQRWPPNNSNSSSLPPTLALLHLPRCRNILAPSCPYRCTTPSRASLSR